MGLIGAAAGAAGSIFGGIGRNKALKKQINAIKAMQRENQDWYDRRYNEDATQRADAQAAMTRLKEAIDSRNKQAAGTAAVMGGTEESVAATKQANANAAANVASDIAVSGEQRKDAVENAYRRKNDAYNQQIAGLRGKKKSMFDIAGDAVSGAVDGYSSLDLSKGISL